MVEEFFLEAIEKYNLIKKKDRVILGVSGGPDSVAMLYSFLKIRKKYKLEIVCAHFNHNLRKESDSEQDFIEKLCRDLGVPFICEKKDVRKFFTGDSLEQTARNLRFDFFQKCASQKKIKKIALAHHKDDLAETVLMRLIRGTGLRGLRGFLPKSNFKKLTIIRPLIGLRKNDILSWLEKKKISFCLDESNREIKFFRNKIRHDLLPQLETMNRSIVERLFGLALNSGMDYDFIYSYSQEQFFKLKKQGSGISLRLSLTGLKSLHPAIFNNVIRVAIEKVKGDTRRLDQNHLNQARSLVKKGRFQASLHLPGILIKKEKDTVSIQSLIL